jgi:LysM repeat protein
MSVFDAPAPATPSAAAADDISEAPAAPAFLDAIPSSPDPAAASTWSSANAPEGPIDEPPVPDFLAGRSDRPPASRPRASRPDVQYREKVTREDVVPSWDLTNRYGADVSDRRGGRDSGGGGPGDRFGGLLTAIAVIVILALGVAGVIFLPGMLSGRPATSPTPTMTPGPSQFSSPTLPVSTQTPIATGPTISPSSLPEPTPTPRLYRIKGGDTLGRIAQRFHVTVAEILAANPQITDADHIEPGQVIVIPQPAPDETAQPSP